MKKLVMIWLCKLTVAFLALFGLTTTGCFPADEGASTKNWSLSLADRGVSASAVNNWLDWRAQDNNLNYDLGVTGNDFYLGLRAINADLVYGDRFTYDSTQNTITAYIYVQNCKLCVFEATVFIVNSSASATLSSDRQVSTFYGKSSALFPTQTDIDINNVEQVSPGSVKCKPVNDSSAGYELAAFDPDEGVRFPTGTRVAGSADSSVTLSTIPKGWQMNIQVSKDGGKTFVTATNQGNPIQVLIPEKLDLVNDCEFDMP